MTTNNANPGMNDQDKTMNKGQKASDPTGNGPQVPRYRQIARQLMDEIQAGKYPVGTMLPAEAELCEIFSASRFTVREALRWMANEQLIDRRRGAGTTVIASEPAEAFVYRLSSVAEILKYPIDTRRENLYAGSIHADPELADKIDCPLGKEWLRISGVRRSESSHLPICWSDIFVLPEFEPAVIGTDDGRLPVFELIERATGTRVVDADIRIFASSIDGKLARILDVPEGTPALSIVRRYLDAEGRNFETSITVHPEKRFEYSMHLKRDSTVSETG